jgi:hypothetical protein
MKSQNNNYYIIKNHSCHMRKISIIIFFIVNILSANASGIKLYGNISDTKGAGLPYVNVKAEVMGTDRVGLWIVK